MELTLQRLGLRPDELAGKVAVVTGAAMGIGRETARWLARLGALVVVADVAAAGGEETVDQIRREGGTAIFTAADVAVEAAVARLAMWTLADLGPADILVNNAIYSPVAPVLDMEPAMFDRAIAVNLRGAYLTCRAFLPGMLAKGGGTVINMVSTDAMPAMAAYMASKQGLAAFSQSLAAEVGDRGIRVVALAPGFVDTPGLRAAGERLAPALGMTAEQFARLSFHPAYEGMMPAAHAGAATAYLAARLAGEYHGEVVTGYTVLERAGAIAAPSETAASGSTSAGQAVPANAIPLARELRAMVADTEAEFGRLPIFVRPLARSGFRQKSGQSLAEWGRMADDLLARLERGEAPAAGLGEQLAKLVNYYEGVPAETARFTRDAATLKQVTDVSNGRVALLRALTASLAASHR